MQYLQMFLEDYYNNIDDYNAMIYILSLLPDSLQYQFVRNILKYNSYLFEGDVVEGLPAVGLISIKNDKIILESGDLDEPVILLVLPEVWDI
ncbi:MAG: hypothetical protein BZ138_08190 [Methanosphaera sp. rholeuAM270]|nr:MAG: hypothetical protein BZ138_08190 [Methanosphaera sp. rholeuAM270]